MKLEEMQVGDSLAGFIIDNKDTPYAHANLHIDGQWGPILQFSYPPQSVSLMFMEENEQERDRGGQHDEIHWWVGHPDEIPEVLVFQTADGLATFYNCRLISSKETARGTNFVLQPATVIFGEFEVTFDAPLRPVSLKSTMTGLSSFINMSAFTISRETDDENRSKSFTATVRSPEPITVPLDDCDVTFSLSWDSTLKRGSALNIYAEAWFETSFRGGASVGEHLRVHRQMRAILALNLGSGSWITRHRVKPPSAPRELKLVHDSTFADSAREVSGTSKALNGLTSMAKIDQDRLANWLQDRDYWHRVTGPVLGILQRESYAIEDRVISTGIAVEAMGKKLDPAPGEDETYRPGGNQATFATYTYRCIVGSCLDFSESGHSNLVLARAFAMVYNKTKHYNPDRQPEGVAAHDLGRMALLVVRAVILRSLLPEESDVEFSDNAESYRISIRLQDLLIDGEGWATYRHTETDNENGGQ